MDLTHINEARELKIYPQLFGKQKRPIFDMLPEVFAAYGDHEIDPRWLSHGVMEFEPNDDRPTWLYVTTGYSNPWGQSSDDWDPDGESGAGVEFILETNEQTNWPVTRLQSLLAFDMLAAAGMLGEDSEPLAFHDIMPLNYPVDGSEDGQIKTMVLVAPEVAEGFQLPSGNVALAQFVGLSDAERDFAAEFGLEHLTDKLRGAGHWPRTVPDRESVV